MRDDPFDAFRRRLISQLGSDKLPWEVFHRIPVTPLSLSPRARLYDEGKRTEELFVVSEGWLIGSSLLRDGKRHIHRIYQAGDLVGVEDTNWCHATSTVETVSECRLGRFRKGAQYELFTGDPRLGAMIHGLSMIDQVVLMDAARANARLGARARLAHLLLQVEARSRLSDAIAAGDPFAFPLNQTEIGDATALTNVSVSKAMGQLVRDGQIERRSGTYRIVRREPLVESCDFADRYRVTMDDWRRLLAVA